MLTDSVGDITPVEGVPSHVKHQLEEAAMDSFLNEMLGGPGNKEARERFRSLWDVRSKRLHSSPSVSADFAGVRSEGNTRVKARQGTLTSSGDKTELTARTSTG